MCRERMKDYFVQELAQLSNGEYIIPIRWIIRKKELHADAWPVTLSEVCVLCFFLFGYDCY